MDSSLLSLLACPSCKGALAAANTGSGLLCASCDVIYPIKDAIPLLLVEEAVSTAMWHDTHTENKNICYASGTEQEA